MNPSRKTTDGSDDPWADVVDPVSGDTERGDPDDTGAHPPGGGGDTGAAPGDPADPGPASPADRLADEARRLAEVLVEQLGDVRDEVHGKVVEPLLRRHPDVAAHLGAAGSELLSAYRAFVAARERRWASRSAPTERVALDLDDDADAPDEQTERPDRPRKDDPETSGGAFDDDSA
ncbi:DUF5304 domain-containing protein [Yinghuangia sp. ASG 101]|uniref:DUF5304 family protein n=1 Tax=Yinghuangia sp. ASG 101 TaxID=2896848 RepID=UPI001E5694CE|nr:DUF5304 family protein [Yinghuangia sp. ASG 101]UGQ09997.1 DUF5304 domain-containing protein [Yinghuangia sp. ASG 101]